MGKRRPVGFQICFKAVSLPRASHCGQGDAQDGGNVDTRLGFVILAAAIPGEWPPDRREWDTRPPREGQQRRHLRSAASLLTAEAVEVRPARELPPAGPGTATSDVPRGSLPPPKAAPRGAP